MDHFAIQTRRQELADDEALKEEQKRILLRQEMKKQNKHLALAAKEAGVVQPVDYATFMDHGYRGLYGELGSKMLEQRKGLTPKENILDRMGSTELAANLFRATQTEKNFVAKMSALSRLPTTCTRQWAGKFGRPSSNSAAPCPRILPSLRISTKSQAVRESVLKM